MDLKNSTLTIAPLQSLLDRMIKEENGLKKRLVESLEHSIKQCVRLSKVIGQDQDNGINNHSQELGMKYDEPDSRLALIKLEHALRGEAKYVEEESKFLSSY